jgi:DNA-binding MarR family transcriptional regulator
VKPSLPRNQLADPETAELARRLAGFFRYVTLSSQGGFLQEVSERDLTLSQLKALSLLDEQPEPLSVKALAGRLGLSLPAASRAVDALFKRGLVERAEDAQDRRVKRIRLTAAGRKLIADLAAIRIADLKRLLGTFTATERRKLDSALETILQREEIKRFIPRQRRAA